MVAGKLDASVRLDRYRGGTFAQLPVVELAACEMNSAHMQEQLGEMQRVRLYNTAAGVGRYIFRMQALAKVVAGPVSVRPKLFPAGVAEGARRPQVRAQMRASVLTLCPPPPAPHTPAHLTAAAVHQLHGGVRPGGKRGACIACVCAPT